MRKKYFYYYKNKSLRYWNILLENSHYDIETGIIGSKPLVKRKVFESSEEAEKAYIKEINKRELTDNIEFVEYKRFKLFTEIRNIIAHLNKKGFLNKAFRPTIKKEKGDITDSKFGGKPFLLKNERWPICGLCQEPMTLFVQLNIDKMPQEVKDSIGLYAGMVQLFYCTNNKDQCGSCGGDYKVNEKPDFQLVRLIDKEYIRENAKIVVPRNTKLFPEKIFFRLKDLGYENPYQEIEYSEIFKLSKVDKYTNKLPKALIDFLKGELYIDEEELQYLISYFIDDRDKIGGYPYWVQNTSYPKCKKCSKNLSIIIQLSSNDHIPYYFSDGGVGHIFICREHKEEIYFYWDCY